MDGGTSDLLVLMPEVAAGSETSRVGGLEVKSVAVIGSDTFRNDHLLSGVRRDVDASPGSASPRAMKSETNWGYYSNIPQSEGGGVADKSSVIEQSEHHAVSRSAEQSSTDLEYYQSLQPPPYLHTKLNHTKELNVSSRLQFPEALGDDLDLQTDSFRLSAQPHSNADSLSLRELIVGGGVGGGEESPQALNFSDSYRTLYEVLVNVTVDNSVPSSKWVTSDQMATSLFPLASYPGAQYPPAVLPGLLPPNNLSIAGLLRAITATSSSISPLSSSSINGGLNNGSGSTVATVVATSTANWLAMGKVQIPLYAIIFLLAVIGNSLVILTLVQNKRMRTITNVFLLNLAISDLFLGVLCMPFTLVGTLKRDFVFGEFMCKILPFLQGTYRREDGVNGMGIKIKFRANEE